MSRELPTRVICTILCLIACSEGWAADRSFASWDKFFYNVAQPVRAVRPTGSLKVMVYHSYPTALTNVRISGSGYSVVVDSVDPPVMAKLNPTEIKPFTVRLRVTRTSKQDTVPIALIVSADQLRDPKPINLTVPLTPKGEKEVATALSVPVGKMDLEVRRWGYEIYYLYLLPMILLLGWFFWRRRRFA
jgi:hypothetical protein